MNSLTLESDDCQGLEGLLKPLGPLSPPAPLLFPHPCDVGENKTRNQWDPVFLQPELGTVPRRAGTLPGQGVGLRKELGFSATLEEPGRAAGHGAGQRNSQALN